MRTSAKPKGGLTSEKLKEDGRELIEVLKLHSPSTSLYEIIEELELLGGQQISMLAVSRSIKSRLPSDHQYSRKKLTKVAMERFTPDNLFYTQLFINYVSSKDPRSLEFFDDAGIKIPDVGTAYGHSAKGSRCVEVGRKLESPKNGPEYYNVVSGATNTARFLSFFQEAGDVVNIQTGRPCLEVGEIVIMDNLSSHHFEGGGILEEWFGTMGIELLFTPSYSRDLNPVELCFNKVKCKLNGTLKELVHSNINLAIAKAVETFKERDMAGFYEATDYLFV